MSEATIEKTDFDDSIEEAVSEYTTETRLRSSRRHAGDRDCACRGHRPSQGRRSHACDWFPAPASGRSTERDLEGYFPNKVHQQEVNEPFVSLGAEGLFDVIARIHGSGISGQAGALHAWKVSHYPQQESTTEGNRPILEGRVPHSRSAGQRTQEVRSQEGS